MPGRNKPRDAVRPFPLPAATGSSRLPAATGSSLLPTATPKGQALEQGTSHFFYLFSSGVMVQKTVPEFYTMDRKAKSMAKFARNMDTTVRFKPLLIWSKLTLVVKKAPRNALAAQPPSQPTLPPSHPTAVFMEAQT